MIYHLNFSYYEKKIKFQVKFHVFCKFEKKSLVYTNFSGPGGVNSVDAANFNAAASQDFVWSCFVVLVHALPRSGRLLYTIVLALSCSRKLGRGTYRVPAVPQP